jgi:hypothetical protein
MADLTVSARIIRINSHERRHIECDTEAGLAVFEQIFEAAIGIVGRSKAGELPHGPEPAAIHGGMDAASVGVGTGGSKILLG